MYRQSCKGLEVECKRQSHLEENSACRLSLLLFGK